jgi:succinate-semialdehyde dehydrogenase/glutarate-semialdehyde dehydrogenase
MSKITIINPATEEIYSSHTIMNKEEAFKIINEMHIVQQIWATTKYAIRKQCLIKAAALFQDNKRSLATILTNEMGKPITQAVMEIEKCAKLCEFYAQRGEDLLRSEIIKTEWHRSYRAFEPIGIIFAIMPWNFPYWQVMRFAVPNLLLGNAGLLKHAPNSTKTALAIEELMVAAGFPQGLFRSLIIDVDMAADIIKHPLVSGVTLTGSSKAGAAVAKEAGMALKKVVLELGGSDPYIILADANLELAAEQCVKSRLSNCGQVCIAAKRLIVVEEVRHNFEALVLEKAKKYQMADPQLPDTNLGPMARSDLRATLHEQVQRAIQKGARCVLGGKLPTGKGYFYPATVLLDVTSDSPVFHEELFGPVICITVAKDEEEALYLANLTEFGLAAAIFTQDLEKGERLAREQLQAGSCAVNTLVASDPRLPFGGIKQSGYGRELSVEGLREFANVKTIVVAIG